MNTRLKSILSVSVSAFLVLMVFMILQQTSCRESDADLFGDIVESPLKKDSKAKAKNIQNTFREIYKLYSDRVVFISTEQTVKMPQHPFFDDPFFREFFRGQKPRSRTQKRTGLGTGFILSADGYISTNHHVIARVDKILVKINNKSYTAKIVGSDERTDIALLKINPDEKLKPVFLGNSDEVMVGDWAIAIGNPFGLDKTFTVGVISATGRKDVDLMGGSQSHIQTDASINPGNSGGPLINIDGEVIGINRMIYSRTGGNLGIGFAIPINKVKFVLAQLKKHKKVKRGFLGVQIVPLSEEYAQEIGLKDNEGALVGAIVDESPAQKGGIMVGDVILAVKDKKIKNYVDLVEVVEKTKIGKTLKVVVWRKKSRLNLFVTVAERP
jgi:serine protease Do